MQIQQEIMTWAKAKEVPERKDLEGIYRAVVCNDCSDMVLMTLSTSAIIKSICRAVYWQHLDKLAKWKVVYFLSLAFGMSERAIYSYLPIRPNKYENIRQIGERGVVATFAGIAEASEATGIPDGAIRVALVNGCRASGFYFKADIVKPGLVY